jgi:hypothetical protein
MFLFQAAISRTAQGNWAGNGGLFRSKGNFSLNRTAGKEKRRFF